MKVTYELTVEHEDAPVRGNAMASGDDAYDKQIEDDIIERLDRDDRWAWCCVKVTAGVTVGGHTFTGCDYLGCVCEDSEESFKENGYYEDMKSEARAHLREEMGHAVKRGEVASAITLRE